MRTRGIRQGDPLSPYIFILCSEGPSALISRAVQQGQIEGLKMSLSSQAPTLHHLVFLFLFYFADDNILYGSANEVECMQYRGILDIYEKAAGQKINYLKSSIVFNKNVAVEQQVMSAAIFLVRCVYEHDC